MIFEEKTVSTNHIFKGRVIDVSVDTVLLPDGKEATRELVRHPGGVCVVAYQDGFIYLVKQYRKPYDEVTIELPAGKLEYGEDHFEAGKRELLEETGVVSKEFIYLGKAYVSPGFCSETIHIYLALGLEKKEQNLDEDEFLDVLKVSFDDAVKMVMQGEIHDAKTIIGILKSEKILREKKML
ncbi:MAG: NUDIX hydrolase [Ruminococcaceae bacterium]|nr:NUDIX hydrolase [Oscillospiraceae bacterium]